MAQHRIKFAELPKALGRLTRNISRAVDRGITKGAGAGRRILERATPKDTGLLRRGWEDVRGAGRVVRVIRNETPYARNVELGSGPHKVTEKEAAALRTWAVRHFKRVASAKKWLRGKRRQAAIDNLIGGWIRKIETRGEKPSYFVRRRVPAVDRAVRAAVLVELQSADKGTK